LLFKTQTYSQLKYEYSQLKHEKTPEDGVKTVKVPWAREGSGFTLLFEIFVLQMANSMSIKEVGKILKEKENRLWRIVKHYIDQEVKSQDYSEEPITSLAMDEVSRKKGHVYITNFVNADIVFDKFHVMKILNEMLDNVRKREQKTFSTFFNKTRYLFLKLKKKLSQKQKKKLDRLLEDESKDTIKAYNLIELFKELFEYKKPSAAGRFLMQWIKLCKASKIPEMISAAGTIYRHIRGILQHIRTKKINAILEGLNSKLRVITKRAFGFKSFEYLRIMVFLTLGKLEFSVLKA